MIPTNMSVKSSKYDYNVPFESILSLVLHRTPPFLDLICIRPCEHAHRGDEFVRCPPLHQISDVHQNCPLDGRGRHKFSVHFFLVVLRRLVKYAR